MKGGSFDDRMSNERIQDDGPGLSQCDRLPSRSLSA